MQKDRLNLNIGAELIKKAKVKAAQDNISISGVVRVALENWVSKAVLCLNCETNVKPTNGNCPE